ncbi:MAG TPA: hypothetical protein VGP22_00795, partial [Albitalea sp.]|nr:hypothetical protein [Albitalea sp.]
DPGRIPPGESRSVAGPHAKLSSKVPRLSPGDKPARHDVVAGVALAAACQRLEAAHVISNLDAHMRAADADLTSVS